MGDCLIYGLRFAPEQAICDQMAKSPPNTRVKAQKRAKCMSETSGEKLGELLIRDGLLNQDQLQRLLKLQQSQPPGSGKYQLLGQLCVQEGLIAPEQMQAFLKKNAKSIRLGELLVRSKVISAEALEQALAQQSRQPDQRLGEILLAQKALNEEQLIWALSQQWNMRVRLPILTEMDLRLIEGLDLKFVHDSGFLPLVEHDGEIVVTMFQPNDMNVLYYLESHFGKKIQRTLSPLSAVRLALKEYYLQRKSEKAAPKAAAKSAPPAVAAAPSPGPARDSAPAAAAGTDSNKFDGAALGALFQKYEKAEQGGLSELSGLSLGSDDDEPDLTGLSLGGGDDEDEENGSTYSAPRFSLYDEEPKGKKKKETAPEPPPEEPPAPLIVEDSLIVGGVSLSSGKSQYQQQEGMLNYLIKNALTDQASAIHLEPQGAFIRVRYRINGVLNQKTALPANLGMPMVARLKQICGLDSSNTTLPQRNRVQASFNDRQLELGLATYPGAHGETMVMILRQKHVTQQAPFLQLEQAGFSPGNLWRYKKGLGQPGGLVIVTGPTRSGKTCTAYATLNHLNLLTRSLSTAESPIEVTLPGINQGNWTAESGISFAEMIRSMADLDADALMIGELDSQETIAACVELALDGAKVVTNYSSFDSMGALLRLKTLGLEPFFIAGGHLLLISQRLVRKLCPSCRHQEPANKELLQQLGLTGIDADTQPVWTARGCPECQQVGYLGQSVLHEVMSINEAMREALLNQQPSAQIRALARGEGQLISMAEDGYYKAVEGITSLAEVQRVASINEYDSRSPRSTEELLGLCRSGNTE